MQAGSGSPLGACKHTQTCWIHGFAVKDTGVLGNGSSNWVHGFAVEDTGVLWNGSSNWVHGFAVKDAVVLIMFNRSGKESLFGWLAARAFGYRRGVQ